ncbi:MAG: hypothetical protein ACRD2Z_15525 [Thermoanaerobaculia bacterium]
MLHDSLVHAFEDQTNDPGAFGHRQHPELLDHENGVLAAHYDPEELASARARHRFILPRRRC